MNPNEIYHRLKKSCMPDFRKYEVYLKPDEFCGYDEEDVNRAKEVITCVRSTLDDYMRFAAGDMDDKDISKFHSKLLSMIRKGIESRKEQLDRAMDEIEDIESQLREDYALYCEDEETRDEYMCEITKEKLDKLETLKREIKRGITEDIEILTDLRDHCSTATTRKEKVICIDTIVTTMHTRGSMLPVLCGARLEEYIPEAIYGEHDQECPDYLGNLGVDLSEDVRRTLDCIRNFK